MTRHHFPCPVLAKGQTCTPCEEVAAIDQEIATLKAKRAMIYGRMNYAHDPLTSKLPAEIVGKIFTNFLPVDVNVTYGVSVGRPRYTWHSRTNPLSLGAVCTAWRAIAWSTPQLWTSISLCLDYINEARCIILRDWLDRSGELPLYVNIYQVDYMDDTALLKEIMNVFTLQSHKWFYFEYNIKAKHIHYLISSFAHARILNTLKIGINDTSKINLGMAPNFRNLCMAGPWMPYLSGVDWRKLTNLEAVFSSVTMCSWVFSNVPSLTHCTFSIRGSKGDTGTIGHKIHQHDHLLFLHIKKKWNIYIDTSLHLLQFPALQHLTIDTERKVNIVTIADCLRRSNCSLKILEVNMMHAIPEETLELFSPLADIPSLGNLEFRCRPEGYFITTYYSINDLRATRKRLRQTF